MNKKTLKDIDFKNKTVLVRVDFNVPLKNNKIIDDKRIMAALPTVRYLVKKEAKVVLISHLGKIKTEADKEKNDMQLIAKHLEKRLKQEIIFVNEVVGEKANKAIKSLQPGQIVLLQNSRYEVGETKNDSKLAKKLSENIDVFVNDAFGTSHRKHASTYGVVEQLKQQNKESAIGRLVEKEVKALNKCVAGEIKPFIAILGGAKVSDKIKVIDGLLEKVDKLIIGGAMAYTFLKAKGFEVGNSLIEENQLEYAKECLLKAGNKIILPVDHVISDAIKDPSFINITLDENIIEDYLGVDIGPKTSKLFKENLADAKMIFWNGPMGVFENEYFASGTKNIAQAIGNIEDVFSVVGGGDSAAFIRQNKMVRMFSHISTGGGASLEIIENNGYLPGIDIIDNKEV